MGAMKEPAATLYEADYYAWTQEQAARLRQGDFAHLDVANLIEEIESLGRSEKRELQSRLSQLLMHLLEWQHQPSKRTNSWLRTLRAQRRGVEALLDDMPLLRPKAGEFLSRAYDDALAMFEGETGLGIEDLPQACPYAFEQIMASGWLPAD